MKKPAVYTMANQPNLTLYTTPRGGVDLLELGTYRVYAGAPDSPARVAAFGGEAVFESANPVTVTAGVEVFAAGGSQTGFTAGPAKEDACDRQIFREDEAVRVRGER